MVFIKGAPFVAVDLERSRAATRPSPSIAAPGVETHEQNSETTGQFAKRGERP